MVKMQLEKINGFIYIIHPRACINANENIYKIGKTKDYTKRIKQYCKGSIYKLIIKVDDITTVENKLIKICNQLFKVRKDYGREYFDADYNQLSSIIKLFPENINIVYEKYDINNINNSNLSFNKRLKKIIKNNYNNYNFIKSNFDIIFDINNKPNLYEHKLYILYKLRKLYNHKCYRIKDKTIIKFNKKYIINFETYEFIKNKFDSDIILDEDEKQQKWTYEASINLWSIPSIEYIDEEFFNDYICHWSYSDMIIDKYFQMKRYECLDLSIETNKTQYKFEIDTIENSYNKYFELYRTKIKSHYQRLIESQNILLYINSKKIKIQDRDIFNTNFDIYFETISELQFINITKIFGLRRNNNYKNKEYIDNDKKKLLYVKSILKQSFDIEVETKKNVINKLFYNFDKWTNFKTKYHLNNENPEEFLFINDENENIDCSSI
jgi:hypothetical protein